MKCGKVVGALAGVGLRQFKRERRTSENPGNYRLDIKACNPACN